MKNEILIIDLFRKIISSLACIINKSSNKELISEANNYILDFINQYNKYLERRKKEDIILKYNENDIIDFSYRCIDDKNDDLILFAEDVQFGINRFNEIN